MDEIVIEDKKYISSKQAAKISGYAKDYVGQLCREGRIPARLVGRSWYVLESAIKDHRFGNSIAEEKKEKKTTPAIVAPALQATWEAPRYEVSSGESLPPINRLRQTEKPLAISEQEPKEEELAINIPIHSLEQALPEKSLFPRADRKVTTEQVQPPIEEEVLFIDGWGRGAVRTIQTILVLMALSSVLLVVNSLGYFDKYIGSFSRVQFISGISIYNK